MRKVVRNALLPKLEDSQMLAVDSVVVHSTLDVVTAQGHLLIFNIGNIMQLPKDTPGACLNSNHSAFHSFSDKDYNSH